MNICDEPTRDLVEQLRKGDRKALAEVFMAYRERLYRMIRLRLDRRLHGRVDTSDVLQEAFLDITKRFDSYVAEPRMPVYLWLRFLTGQTLQQFHRRHLGTQMRDAGKEISLYRGALPQASSVSLAAQLLGKMTSPSQAAVRAETQLLIQEALNSMDLIDREILALRHFEELTNNETAEVLGLSKAAASNRYVRALRRLRKVLKPPPGYGD